MRLIRLLGAVVIFYGLSYLLHALLQILGSIFSKSAPMLHMHIIGLNLCIGTACTVIGIGLLLSRNWARIAWLVTVTLLVLEHCLILFLWYVGGSDITGQILNVALTSFLAVISWGKLTQESTKKYFA
jgi:hypothetical protein